MLSSSFRISLLGLVLCLTTSLVAAQFNPRVSSRTIALNQTVRATFNTMRPQRTEVDIGAAIDAAMRLPGIDEHWRVVEADFEQHEKAKDITVTLVLAPRHPGTVKLPDVPVSWLDGNRIANLGEITVEETLRIGNTDHELPAELAAIGGYQWGLGRDAIIALDQRNTVADERGSALTIATATGLQLNLLEDRLTEATLTVNDLTLERAGTSFVQRWGVPVTREDGGLEWTVGWLEIIAQRAGEGCTIQFAHEGIRQQATQARVANDVFSVLEGTNQEAPSTQPESATQPEPPAQPTAPEAAVTAEPTPATATPAATKKNTEPSMKDLEAEFERQLRQLDNQ